MSAHDANDRLIAATMTWLRLLLVPPGPAVLEPELVTTPTIITPSNWTRIFRRIAQPHPPQPELPPIVPARSVSTTATRDVARARDARRDLLTALTTEPTRVQAFSEAFGLSAFERDIVLLGFVHALSTEIARLCAAMPESVNGHPTFALVMALASDPDWDVMPGEMQEDIPRIAAAPMWDAMAPTRPLRNFRLIEITQSAGQSLISSPIRLDERIVNHLLGIDYLDDRIAALARPLPNDGATLLSDSQYVRLNAAIERLHSLQPERSSFLIQLPGTDIVTKHLHARALAAAFGLDLFQVSANDPGLAQTIASFTTLWNRELLMQPAALLVNAADISPDLAPTLHRLLDGLGGVVLLDVTEPLPNRDAIVLDVARPDVAEQRHLWQRVLGDTSDNWPARLASQFSLNLGEFADAWRMTRNEAILPDEVGAQVWATYRASARPRLDGLARRSTATTRLSDVQLPENERRLLTQIRDQARLRLQVYDDFGFRDRLQHGLGITALFAGESGTGKTMAAEAIANDLGLDLYRIDLASVVSKYIGETEKNLRQVFDAAEMSGVVLLFDEADAIFGKRSEVRDSHDRYANLEVSYLLQRMEAYAGLAILTTNMKQALDQAFLRRLRFIVNFPFPAQAERERIWRGIFPIAPDDALTPRMPGVEALDFAALARPNLTGGQIRNIALNGSFLAATSGSPLTMTLLRQAAGDELRKGGNPFVASDFAGWIDPSPANSAMTGHPLPSGPASALATQGGSR